MRKRRSTSDNQQRPEYEGMGLGLFIAKTLLERSGAELKFANGPEIAIPNDAQTKKVGAIVEVVWPRDAIDARHGSNAVPIGLNQHITN